MARPRLFHAFHRLVSRHRIAARARLFSRVLKSPIIHRQRTKVGRLGLHEAAGRRQRHAQIEKGLRLIGRFRRPLFGRTRGTSGHKPFSHKRTRRCGGLVGSHGLPVGSYGLVFIDMRRPVRKSIYLTPAGVDAPNSPYCIFPRFIHILYVADKKVPCRGGGCPALRRADVLANSFEGGRCTHSRSLTAQTITCSSRCCTRWPPAACLRRTSPQPIRSILSNRPDITGAAGQGHGFRPRPQKKLSSKKSTLDYDYLVLGMGGPDRLLRPSGMGKNSRPASRRLMTPCAIRSHILLGLRKGGERTRYPPSTAGSWTIVIVGGGPTGVELAGSFAELTRTVLSHDFPPHRSHAGRASSSSRAGPRPCSRTCRRELSASAQRQLEGPWCAGFAPPPRCKNIRAGEVELAGGRKSSAREKHPLGRGAFPPTPLTKKLDVETRPRRTREGESGI